MSLYADTSALVKKYVQEAGSEQVVAFFDQYSIIGTSTFTFVEMAAALAKAVRLGWVEESATHKAWQDFVSHWQTFTRLPVSKRIIELSASIAWRHTLCAYDSLQLASALYWNELNEEETVFACFDKTLLQAAEMEGLQTWPNGMAT